MHFNAVDFWALIGCVHYTIGLLWLLSGWKLGWLTSDAHPLLLAIWTLAMAAIWPLLLAKFIWDVCHGRDETEL